MIDAFTLIAWRALGTPRFFYRWWARESPPYRAISLLARAGALGPPHGEHREARAQPGSSRSWHIAGAPHRIRIAAVLRPALVALLLLAPAASAQAAPLTTPCWAARSRRTR